MGDAALSARKRTNRKELTVGRPPRTIAPVEVVGSAPELRLRGRDEQMAPYTHTTLGLYPLNETDQIKIVTMSDLRRYGSGMPRSLQIFLARSSLTSVCRGTVDVLPEGPTKIEWLPPSRSRRQPFCSR